MKLVIPGTLPTVNHMYRNAMVKGRRVRVLTEDAKAWSDELIIRASMWRSKQNWQTVKGKVIVRLWYYFPDRRKRDTHNTLKLLLDCLEDAQIYDNDQYALPRIMDWQVDRENPRTEIEFEVVI